MGEEPKLNRGSLREAICQLRPLLYPGLSVGLTLLAISVSLLIGVDVPRDGEVILLINCVVLSTFVVASILAIRFCADDT